MHVLRLKQLGAFLQAQMLEETQQWILWVPVGVATGILCYFALPVEPPLLASLLALPPLVLAAIYTRLRHSALFILLLALLSLTTGFAAANLRAVLQYAPQLHGTTDVVRVEGKVLAINALPQGYRLLLGKVRIRGIEAKDTPLMVRITSKTAIGTTRIGDRVRMKAVLSPFALPVSPSGYDFARDAYFAQVGASGYTVTKLYPVDESSAAKADKTFWDWLADTRSRIGGRVMAELGPIRGPIATAVMIGDYSAIDKDILNDMRVSSLAHILSVSGMHLSLVALLFFTGSRILLCFYPPFALRFPVKKIAAAIALAGTFLYLLISGMEVAAQRSFIMTATVLGAIMADRTALGMRSVAFAALLIMLLEPESVVGPSFQMSFAAVIALIASYRLAQQFLPVAEGFAPFKRSFAYLLGSIFSSLIAGSATTPFALYHFNQLSSYGVLANLIAVPASSLLIMPATIISFFLMPFGLENWGLIPMRWGVDMLIWAAHFTTTLPYSMTLISSMSVLSLCIITLGGLWLTIWQGKWRIWGIIPIILGFALIPFTPKPDILLSGKGGMFALRTSRDELIFSSHVKSRYSRQIWQRQNGQEESLLTVFKEENEDPWISCNEGICLYRKTGEHTSLPVALVTAEAEGTVSAPSCPKAEWVINLTETPLPCVPGVHMFTLEDLQKRGSHALYISDKAVKVRTVAEMRGKRLWTE